MEVLMSDQKAKCYYKHNIFIEYEKGCESFKIFSQPNFV
ncbi:hypothetical protein C823_007577 [Eubacterium plexicaudatum ASF492]|uniref:Uncharacterized protein n=1 Tax=Eubacterium plexicaudatum ASF492 TaxID=1235802 RepID=N1ZWI8_9FIRM|nr:hypothetical protein C823_007577 [Eubacterium plexicaudatum ASF492]